MFYWWWCICDRWSLMLATRNVSYALDDPLRLDIKPIQCKPGS